VGAWFVKKLFQNDEPLALVAKPSPEALARARRLHHAFSGRGNTDSASTSMQEAYAIAEQVRAATRRACR
jgi:hypothetical protein